MQLIISCLLFTTMLMKNVSAGGPTYVGEEVCQYHEKDNYFWVQPGSAAGIIDWDDAVYQCNELCRRYDTSHFVIGDVRKGENYEFYWYDVKCWCEGTKTHPCGTKKSDANKWLYKVDYSY